MNEIKFSVIVPVYNTEMYLSECIESIISQTYKNFEIFLVDDGSTDKSAHICDDYKKKDNRIHVIHKKNGGLVSARKAGIKKCSGSYILNLDSDDYIALDLLERIVEIINTNNHPEIIGFNFINFFGTYSKTNVIKTSVGNYEGVQLDNLKKGLIYDSEDSGINFGKLLWGVVLYAINRELLFKFQMAVPNEISKGEDLAVMAPLIESCKSLYVSGINGYYYRKNPHSIMHTFNEKEIFQYKILFDYLLKSIGNRYSNSIYVYMLHMINLYIGKLALNFNSYKEFKKCLLNNIDDTIFFDIKKAKVKHMSFKEFVKINLIKKKYFYIIWLSHKRHNRFIYRNEA